MKFNLKEKIVFLVFITCATHSMASDFKVDNTENLVDYQKCTLELPFKNNSSFALYCDSRLPSSKDRRLVLKTSEKNLKSVERLQTFRKVEEIMSKSMFMIKDHHPNLEQEIAQGSIPVIDFEKIPYVIEASANGEAVLNNEYDERFLQYLNKNGLRSEYLTGWFLDHTRPFSIIETKNKIEYYREKDKQAAIELAKLTEKYFASYLPRSCSLVKINIVKKRITHEEFERLYRSKINGVVISLSLFDKENCKKGM